MLFRGLIGEGVWAVAVWKNIVSVTNRMNEKLTRCGSCGAWQDDPGLYTEEEQNDYELVYCGCENYNGHGMQYITRDMAIDAGDLSLEGQIY